MCQRQLLRQDAKLHEDRGIQGGNHRQQKMPLLIEKTFYVGCVPSLDLVLRMLLWQMLPDKKQRDSISQPDYSHLLALCA